MQFEPINWLAADEHLTMCTVFDVTFSPRKRIQTDADFAINANQFVKIKTTTKIELWLQLKPHAIDNIKVNRQKSEWMTHHGRQQP